MSQASPPQHNCVICNKPVDLKTTKTNDYGKAIHEECYVLKEVLKYATQLNRARMS